MRHGLPVKLTHRDYHIICMFVSPATCGARWFTLTAAVQMLPNVQHNYGRV